MLKVTFSSTHNAPPQVKNQPTVLITHLLKFAVEADSLVCFIKIVLYR